MVYLDTFPAQDAKMRIDDNIVYRTGGNAANSAMIFTQLSTLSTYFLGSLPESISIPEFSRFPVDYSICPRHPASSLPTSIVMITRDNHSRTIIHSRNQLPELHSRDFRAVLEQKQDFQVVHFEGRNVPETLEMTRILREAAPCSEKLLLSVEFEANREGIETLSEFPDILFFSRGFVQAKGFDNPRDFFDFIIKNWQLRTQAVLVCAWGSLGAFGYIHASSWGFDSTRVEHAKAIPLDVIVETVAAGDTFNAAFLVRYHSSRNLSSALLFACEIAAKKLQRRDLAVLSD